MQVLACCVASVVAPVFGGWQQEKKMQRRGPVYQGMEHGSRLC